MRGDDLCVAEHTLQSPSFYSSFAPPLLNPSQIFYFSNFCFTSLSHPPSFFHSVQFSSSPSSFPLNLSILTPSFFFISLSLIQSFILPCSLLSSSCILFFLSHMKDLVREKEQLLPSNPADQQGVEKRRG